MLEVGDSQPWQGDAADMDQFSACDEVLSETRLREETLTEVTTVIRPEQTCAFSVPCNGQNRRTRLSRIYFSILADANTYIYIYIFFYQI